MFELGQIGRYEIQRRLGRGGMGTVYVAHDSALGRMVAIKFFGDDLDVPQAGERFAREAGSAALSHPNVVTVFDFGEDDSQAFIVMEVMAYVPGETLAGMVRRKAPVSIADKLLEGETVRGGRLRPRDARDSSRHQAGEPHGRPCGSLEGPRLRHGPHAESRIRQSGDVGVAQMTPRPDPRRTGREAVAQRRTVQLEAALQEARRLLARGQLDATLAQRYQALTLDDEVRDITPSESARARCRPGGRR